ncbi:MAG: hypothetical protein ACRC62_19120 [Microcoleus sp.]
MTATINGKEYEVLEFQGSEVVASKYPGFAAKGVVAMYTLKRRGRIYTTYKFSSGGFSKVMAAFGG